MKKPNFSYTTEPYLHQRRAFTKMKDSKAYGLFMDTGTGKTKCIIDNICSLYLENKLDAVVICGPNGMIHQWANSNEDNYKTEWKIHAHPYCLENYKCYNWSNSATKKNRIKQVNMLVKTDKLLIITINVEAFVTNKAKNFIQQFLSYHKKTMLIVDESTTIKNIRAKRTRAIITLGKIATYKRILTGTPITVSPLDLFAQIYFLDMHIFGASFVNFRSRYAILKKQYLSAGRSFDAIVGFQRLDEMQDKLKTITFRAVKEECVELPPKVFIKHKVYLTKEQERAYENLKNQIILEIEKEKFITAQNVLVKTSKLRQLVSGGMYVDEVDGKRELYLFKENPRLNLLSEILETLYGKTIIWCQFKFNVEQIEDIIKNKYGPKSYVTYYGNNKLNAVKKKEYQQQFNDENSNIKFWIGTPQTGKFGLNLTGARNTVYFNNDYALDVRIQTEDRICRIGQKHKMTFIDLFSPDTIEEKIFKCLRERKLLSNAITGDNWKEWL